MNASRIHPASANHRQGSAEGKTFRSFHAGFALRIFS
jgi:hypothetical protein